MFICFHKLFHPNTKILKNIKNSDYRESIVNSNEKTFNVLDVIKNKSQKELVDLYKQASNNRGMDINKIYEPKQYVKLFDEYIEMSKKR